MPAWSLPPRNALLVPALVGLALLGCNDKDKEGDDTGTNVCLPPEMSVNDAEAVFLGAANTDHMGDFVAAGDNNGDGVPDLVSAATGATVDGDEFVGRVVVAHNPGSGSVDLATSAAATITGDREFDYLGEGLEVADFTGDGYAEVMIGARGNDKGAEDGGSAYIFYGPLEGDLKGTDAELKVTVQESLWDPCPPFDYEVPPYIDVVQANMGRGLINGDFDDNGYMDIAVGLPGIDAVFVYAGPFEAGYLEVGTCYANDKTDELTVYGWGLTELDQFGAALESADLDADGAKDLLIASPEYLEDGERVGRVFTLTGVFGYSKDAPLNFEADGGGVEGTSLANRPNGAMASVGDVNGDGFGDVLLGVDYGVTDSGSVGGSKEGKAILVHGPISSELTVDQADGVLVGVTANDKVGASVATPGDVNQDGETDFLIGAPGVDAEAEDAGAAYIVFGPLSGTITTTDADVRVDGAASDVRAGTAVASAGDVNADGFNDMYITAPGDPSGYSTGAAYLLYGCVR